MKRVHMTPEGKKSLEEELDHLEGVARFKIIKDIEEARAHGDISENSEYEDAKNRQAMCEGRIQDIKAKLSLAQVIDAKENMPPPGVDKSVIFGCTVMVEGEDGVELTYKIVGVDEADVKKGKISYQSPLGRALIGKGEDDEVKFTAPKGLRVFEVIEIRYE